MGELSHQSYRAKGIAVYSDRSLTIELHVDDDAKRQGALTKQGHIDLDIGPTGNPTRLTAEEARKLSRALDDAAEEFDPIRPRAGEPDDG